MRVDPLHHSDSTVTVPNVLTAFRIVMALGAASCFAAGVAERAAVVVCVVAALLDAFDGWYARTFAQCSSLGKHLDPLADKLLMAVVYGVCAVKLHSPWVWALVSLIAAREVAITILRAYSLRRHHRFIPANRWGKAKMILQSTVGLAIIAYAYLWNGGFDFSHAVVIPALLAILFVSYASAFIYVRAWFTGVESGERVAVGTGSEYRESESGRMVVGR